MKYKKPEMEMVILDAQDIVRTSLTEDPNEGTIIPGLPGTNITS